jgi:hypothetical protein
MHAGGGEAEGVRVYDKGPTKLFKRINFTMKIEERS